jgi:outer membrane biosynthesis protein TonB
MPHLRHALAVTGLALVSTSLGCSRAEPAPAPATAQDKSGGAAEPKAMPPAANEEPKATKSAPAAGGGGAGPGGGSVSAGAAQVTGSLAPEVISRVVRQSFDRIQACYSAGLRANPALQGRVSIKLVIGKNGGTKSATVASSDLADKEVTSCVAKVFASLSFPQPEREEVTVVYPVAFSPGEPAP